MMNMPENALVIHIPAGEIPSAHGHWSMSRFDPFGAETVRMREVEVWDGLSDPFSIPVGEVMLFLMEMKKKYDN